MLGLDGQELVWLKTAFDAYAIHVNGSARLLLRDGSAAYVGYAATNGREYGSLGQTLAQTGELEPEELSMDRLRRYAREHPRRFNRFAAQANDRFVFFQFYSGQDWPAGSLGFKVTPWRSLATDKRIFPRGAPVLVQTLVARDQGDSANDQQPFTALMLDQDTGGAIRAPGRADIFMGVGEEAGKRAGRQMAQGRLFYLLLKPQAEQAGQSVVGGHSVSTEPSPPG
jgi:membrane-bound lytic murein transglycosylase A